MTDKGPSLPAVLEHSPVHVVFGACGLTKLGALAREEGAQRVLLVTDPGIREAGHVGRAEASLCEAGLVTSVFDRVSENPTTAHVENGLGAARDADVDFLVALGGGSAMDCAKGINLLLSNGGQVAEYWGVDKAVRPMRPMIAIPTTAGTGSEAQSFALISDATTHQKMACGDRRHPRKGGLRPRVAILDPELTRSQPPAVAAAAGIDAVTHALESSGSTARNDVSRAFSREAWRLLDGAFERAMTNPADDDARAAMLLGAHLAGAAIENAMLGAGHACANPLTSEFGMTHGRAVGLMLPAVVRFNAERGANPYADLCDDPERLALRLEALLDTASIPRRLREYGIPEESLPRLAELAAKQWTAGFNPRPAAPRDLLRIYRAVA
ncbi:MAG: iron-containing alcohol dehydrogenase [Phycisphaerae bacterium]|nr:iron-containing alcohol dehydrogenase [Phycisphaerae bacterium]